MTDTNNTEGLGAAASQPQPPIERRGPGRPSNAEREARAATLRSGSASEASDSLRRAMERAAEIRKGADFSREAANEFDLPLEIIPEGWSYEWKRCSVYGKMDSDNLMEMARTGWTAVPASRHPTLMPSGYQGHTIERKGLVLMERPMVVTEEARRRATAEARRVVADKERALGQTPAGEMPRDADPRTRPQIKSEFYRPIPDDAA